MSPGPRHGDLRHTNSFFSPPPPPPPKSTRHRQPPPPPPFPPLPLHHPRRPLPPRAALLLLPLPLAAGHHRHRQSLPRLQHLPILLRQPYSRRRPRPLRRRQVVGRVVLGLYGNVVPITVSNFKAMCTGSSGSSYKGTLVQKIFPGQFFLAGRQGRRDKGEVKPPTSLVRNTETVESKAFLLEHTRPGTLSLCLSENDDDDDVKLNPDYHNVEFLITTGPGPCPQLDSKNIVFGSVIEGMDVVGRIGSIPTYKASERIRQYNEIAEFLGDGRAKNARAIWNKPVNTLYISDCGQLKLPTPPLPPTLP